MRLNDEMRAFVRTHYYRIETVTPEDGKGKPFAYIAPADMGRFDAWIARNIMGRARFPDYADLSCAEMVDPGLAMDSWEARWPSLMENYNELNALTNHLIWLTARYRRRFGG